MSRAIAYNPNIPRACNGCGAPLILENLFVEDGCPCNSPHGVNFKTKTCALCGGAECARPGHRIRELFGEHLYTDTPTAAHAVGEEKSR